MEEYFKGKNHDTPRQATEKKVAEEFMSILQRHHRNVRRSSVSVEDGINEAERKILSRTSYQDWTLGFAAGAVTFGALVGITMRSAAAANRYALPKRAPSGYRELDSGGGGAAAAAAAATTSRQMKGGKRKITRKRQIEESLEIPVNKQVNIEALDPTSINGQLMSEGTCRGECT